jgi:hypothetical protein
MCSGLHNIQTGSGSHPSSCSTGIDVFFFRGEKRPGREINHSPLFTVVVKNEWPRIPRNGMDGEDLTIQGNSA